jgi:hypothetical protein
MSLVVRDYGHQFTFTIRKVDGPLMSCTLMKGEARRLLTALQECKL